MNSSDEEGSRKAQRPAGPPSLDALLQRQQPGTSSPANSPSRDRNPATPAKNLQQILTEAGGGQGVPAVPSAESHRGSPATNRAQDLVNAHYQAHSTDSAAGRAQGKYTQKRDQPMPSLDDVLRPSQQTALTDRRQRDMGGRRPVSTTLDDALLKTGKTAISTGDKPGESSVAPSRRKFASIALGGLTVALVASVLLFRPNPSLPDSEVARRLLTVVEDIARYKKQNNRLPQRLSELPGFPQDAVEWPIEDYAVRLASPKMEFFFVDAPGGYIVIARFADEVWVFDSLKAKPLRRESPG